MIKWLAILPIPSLVYALGIGDLQVESHLNEPLSARLPLIDTKGYEVSDLVVRSALHEEYEKLGLDISPWLQQIKFEVIKEDNGQMVVQLSSSQVIKDPIVDVVLQVNWPKGKLIRDFTLLLDPPEFKISKKIASKKLQFAENTPSKAVKSSLSSDALIQNQTLWSIAKKLVEGTEFSVYQGVVGIVAKNPEVFKQGFHNIKQGTALSMPTSSELKQFSKEQAVVLFEKQQKGQFVDLPKLAKTTVKAEKTNKVHQSESIVPTEADQATARESSKNTKHLTLVSPTEVQAASENASDNELALKQRIQTIERSIDQLKRTNDDISTKNQELQLQNQTLMQTLSLRENELNQLRGRSQATVNAYGDEVKTSTHANQITIIDERDSHSYGTPDKPLAPSAPMSDHEAPIMPKLHQDVVDVEEASTIYSKLFGLFFGACLLAWAWFTRNTLRKFVLTMKTAVNEQLNQRSKKSTHHKDFLENIPNRNAHYGINFDLDSSIKELTREDAQPKVKKAAPLHTIEDAEIYIAYEHYDQAIKLLKLILKNEPENFDALVKLLEVFVMTEQYSDFDTWVKYLPTSFKSSHPELNEKVQNMMLKVQNEKPMAAVDLPKAPPHIDESIELTDCPLPPEDNQLIDLDHADTLPSVSVVEEPVKPSTSTWGNLSLVEQDDYEGDLAKAKAHIESGDIELGKTMLNDLLVKAPQLKSQIENVLDRLS